MKRNTSRKAEEAYLAETLRVVRDNVREYGQEVAKMQEDIDEMLEHYHDNDAEVLTILNNTVTMHTHMKRALERNEKALKKPYFGRIVFHDEALNKEESLYIGRGGIAKDTTHQMVTDWRAPVANAYYENGLGKCSYPVPDGQHMEIELLLKRTYEIEDAKLIDPRIHPLPDTVESSYLRIEPRETYYSITVANGTAQVGDDTTGLNTAFAGEKVTVSGKNENPSVTKFGGWKVISPEGFELTEEQKNTEESMTFTMPASPVELKASYSFPAPVVDMPVIVTGGTIRVGGGESQTGTVLVQPGQTVTIEANEPVKENESFHHWKVENGTSTAFAPTEGSLGSETEKGTEKIVFTMPQDGVKLTAVYSIPASVLRSTVTVEGGTAKSTLGEGSDIPAEIGTTVEITATPYDAEKYPGMEFVEWEIVYPDSFYEKFPGGIPENLQLKLDNAKSAATTFEMPVYPVKLIAHWSASAVTDPDEPIDEDFGVEPAPMDTTGGAIAAVAVGGAAIWGGYEIATRVILNDLLPAGAAIPANRGQLALLVWNTAGRPEPAGAPAFADVTDPDMAKAAQWCTEQGTMAAKGDRFEPEGWTPKFKVIEVWNKAFPAA